MKLPVLVRWKSVDEMLEDFEVPESILKGFEVIFGVRSYGSWEGSAFVLLLKGKQVYTVSGSHCSCRGLEGQWSPGKDSVAALRMRKNAPYAVSESSSEDQLTKVLDYLEERLCLE